MYYAVMVTKVYFFIVLENESRTASTNRRANGRTVKNKHGETRAAFGGTTSYVQVSACVHDKNWGNETFLNNTYILYFLYFLKSFKQNPHLFVEAET